MKKLSGDNYKEVIKKWGDSQETAVAYVYNSSKISVTEIIECAWDYNVLVNIENIHMNLYKITFKEVIEE